MSNTMLTMRLRALKKDFVVQENLVKELRMNLFKEKELFGAFQKEYQKEKDRMMKEFSDEKESLLKQISSCLKDDLVDSKTESSAQGRLTPSISIAPVEKISP